MSERASPETGTLFELPTKQCSWITRIGAWIATGFGIGFLPIAPGTFGSILGLALYLIVGRAFSIREFESGITLHAYIFPLIMVIGIWASNCAEKMFGRHDDRRIVIDEVAGIWLTLLALPMTWKSALLGFGLFRLFDIVKPFPVNWFDRRMGGGWGVMLDDVMAGVYAHAVLSVAVHYWGLT